MTNKGVDTLDIRVHARDAATGVPLAEVVVQLQTVDGKDLDVLAESSTGPDGIAVLELDPALWRQELMLQVDHDGPTIPISRGMLNGTEDAVIEVAGTNNLNRDQFNMLAEHLIATRMVRVDDVASDLASPGRDSVTRMFGAGTRARLLADIDRTLNKDYAGSTGDALLLDPQALREGRVQLIPVRDLKDHLDLTDRSPFDSDLYIKPGFGWDRFHWALPDDQSYRNYLRSVFVLFAHQQKLGVDADPKDFPDVVERQLTHRFFQDFKTTDRTTTPLNRLLIPIVTRILTSAKGSGFGFAVATASLPVQGTKTDRQHLDALLAVVSISVDEFANRYRLQLNEPDSTMSSPILLNIYTLSRILSDTAQGPVEPQENIIEPQLPGVEGKPILWKEVVGSAPFFLRFDEWLARQQPFFAENLFALRTQVEGANRGIWLDDARKRFLEYHNTLPFNHSMTPYNGYFDSMGEVHRSATFLLEYGLADAKLTELIQALDKNQFTTAARLADEAERLLQAASPNPVSGENWEPSMSVGNFSRPLSFARRRRMKVSNITELTGTPSSYPPDGFEHFFQLARPIDLWLDVVHFRIARDQVTRLRVYQQRFLLPMLRVAIRSGLGDLAGAVEMLGGMTGMHVGIAMIGTPAGMVKHPDAIIGAKRVVAGRLRWNDQLGDRPYTARLMYTDDRYLDGPYPLTQQMRGSYEALTPEPPMLHQLEERYARIVQADAILAWAESLYRTDDPSTLERARELYKAVLFLHGEDSGTSAYRPMEFNPLPWIGLIENPRVRNQIDRARLALHQLASGLNFYGYSDSAVPTLRYETLIGAAGRWATGARSAQADYLNYLSRMEQMDLDLLVAKAQERKARATVGISAEQIEIAKAGVVVAKKLAADVEKMITAKQQEIADANSIFNQFKDYFKGMKESVTSMVDVGKSASEGWTSLSTSGVGEALGLGPGSGAGAGTAATQSAGLGSAMGGLGVVGGFAAFAVVSTTTLQGMADAATKRDGELKTLINEARPAAAAAVRVQERNVTIANLQAEIAATDLAYARDLINYQNERFLNRDFWEALAGVARRSLHRYLDLAAQAAWFAERALAYMLGTPLRIIRLGYFDSKMRDVGGVDRLSLDLAELEAVRIAAARVTVPLTRTYSLAQDLPLAFGQLKSSGRCTFTLSDDELIAAHPGTYAHRIRAIDVFVDAPGTTVAVRGMLTNAGFSRFRREPDGTPQPLVRFADAYPVSEFRVRRDMELHGLPGERLLPFEGSGFATSWTLELPQSANATALNRITDVRITFDVQAGYSLQSATPAPALPTSSSRAVFVSSLAIDSVGLATLKKSGVAAKISLSLDKLALPAAAVISNLAILIPGVDSGNFNAEIRFENAPPTAFTIDNGLAMSNSGALSDGVPANARPLNQEVGNSPARSAVITINKGANAALLGKARDVMVWLEYETP